MRWGNKYRHFLMGYTSPRTFSSKQVERSVLHVFDYVEKWRRYLREYSESKLVFENKDILELGPGPDLGTGVILLAFGARSYTAFDKFRLIRQTPLLFYKILLEKLKNYPFFERAKNAVEKISNGEFSGNFMYISDRQYNIDMHLSGRYDLVISQAVMEHLDNPSWVIKEIYRKMRKNGIIFGEVDTGTHTGILRDIDPLNLYRYSDFLWNLLKFQGSPNRVLPSEYHKMLVNESFKNVKIQPNRVYKEKYVKKSKIWLSKKFRNASKEDIRIKSFLLFGAKEKGNTNYGNGSKLSTDETD
ncbi:MAG: methyltransferase domain-containing protein [bacterium]